VEAIELLIERTLISSKEIQKEHIKWLLVANTVIFKSFVGFCFHFIQNL